MPDATAEKKGLRSAVDRTRGLGPRKEELSVRFDELRSRPTEGPREWLARLDATGKLLSSGSGYRGQALDEQDLWKAVEDPDADPELHTGAARVLESAGKPGARLRIDAAAAASHDDVTQARLRAAVEPDPDAAVEELMRAEVLAQRRHARG